MPLALEAALLSRIRSAVTPWRRALIRGERAAWGVLEVDSRQHRSFDKGFGGEQAGECAGEPGAEVGPGGKGGREDGVEGEDAGNEGRGVVAGVVGDGGDAVGLAVRGGFADLLKKGGDPPDPAMARMTTTIIPTSQRSLPDVQTRM